MSSQDRNQSMSFDFFKKRRKSRQSNQRNTDPLSSPISLTSPSESFLNGSQNSRSTPLPRYSLLANRQHPAKRGTFRGILSENATPASQNSSTQNSTQNDETVDSIPPTPFINLELCKPYNYILWLRDQMILGNNNLVSIVHLEQMFIQQFKELEKLVNTNESIGIEHTILRLIYNDMKDLHNSYSYLLENGSQISNASTNYLNPYVFLKPVNFTNFSFSTSFNPNPSTEVPDTQTSLLNTDDFVEENPVNVEGEIVNGPALIHDSLLHYFNNNYEFLPSKLSNKYECKYNNIEYDYSYNLINKILYQRTLKQLIVVKSNIDINNINLNIIEGYEISGMRSGEKYWLPIYICDKLSYDGYVTVELPYIMTKEYLRQLRKLEIKSPTLQKLPNSYFFELTYIFTKSKLFKKFYIPNLKRNEDLYSYISKVTGLVEDIRYIRLKKIHNFLENLEPYERIIKLENFQFSETYIINQYLYGYCSFDDRNRKMSNLPFKQVNYLLSDLENTLIDSLNFNIV